MKSAVITLIREGELESFNRFFAALSPQLNPQRTLVLLANGPLSESTQKSLESLPNVHLIKSPTNLGVAGGRNRLIQEAMNLNTEIIVSLDNDILIPADYLEKIELIFSENKNVGIVAPVLLNYLDIPDFKNSYLNSLLDKNLNSVTAVELKKAIELLPGPVRNQSFYHAGIRHFQFHYLLSGANLFFFIDRNLHRLGRFWKIRMWVQKKFGTEPARSIYWRNELMISNNLLEVDCLPGGAQIFRPELYRKIGPVDEDFNPFGYEDSEFSIRAKSFGYKNYSATSLFAIHDVQCRNANRLMAAKHYHIGRARALMQKKVSTSTLIWFLSKLDSFFLMPIFVCIEASRRKQSKIQSLRSYLRGLSLKPNLNLTH